MTWLNEHDVDEMFDRLDSAHPPVPNLTTAASILDALVAWTNANSDGWPYWNKPSKAAAKLQDALHARDYAIRFGQDRDGTALEDLDMSTAELTKALAPIKAFLTKQGVDHGSVLPWAALLPAT